MIVVLDTNVLFAAFATRGLCESVLELCLDRHMIATSEPLLQELTRNLASKIHLDPARVSEVEGFVRSVSRIVSVAPLNTPVCRDEDDDHILALATASGAGIIITGDKDLLILERFESVEILNPRSFWERERLV